MFVETKENEKQEIVIYGAGKRCEQLISSLDNKGIKILAVIDRDEEKAGKTIGPYTISSKDRLYDYNAYHWCISVQNMTLYWNIREELIENYGYDENKLILYNDLIFQSILNSDSIVESVRSRLSILAETQKSNIPVLFGLIGGLVLGGIEERVKQLCLSLLQSGRNNVFILSNSKDYSDTLPDELSSHIIKCDIQESMVQNILNLIQVIATHAPCIIVTNQYDELLVASYVVKAINPKAIKVISVISGANEYIYGQYFKFSFRSDLYIGVSKDIEARFKNEGIWNITSMTVPFPCDRYLKRNYSGELEPIRIGYAGRFDGMANSQKRMDLLLKVLIELEKRNVDFIMELAGEGPAEPEMKAIISENFPEGKVRFVGKLPKDQIKNFWSRQDVGINMADFEGRSISIAEMMGWGAVPVVTDTSGVKEDICNGENGYIIPVGDYELAADRIEYLFLNREKIRKMGEIAHKSIWPKSRMSEHLKFWEGILNF